MGKFGATRDHGLGSQMCWDVAILGISLPIPGAAKCRDLPTTALPDWL